MFAVCIGRCSFVGVPYRNSIRQYLPNCFLEGVVEMSVDDLLAASVLLFLAVPEIILAVPMIVNLFDRD